MTLFSKFRIDGLFMMRAGAALTALIVSLSAGFSVQAQDSTSPKDDLTPEGLIAFTSGEDGVFDIYVMKADGTQVDRLTDDGGYDPAWSPDGRQIAFTSTRDGNKEIYVMNADGRRKVRLTNHISDDGYATWSPDGQHIVFMSNRDGVYDVYIMDTDGSSVALLKSDPTAYEDYMSWSSQGHRALFSTSQGLSWNIYTMYPNLCHPETLSTSSEGSEADLMLNKDRQLFASFQSGVWSLYTTTSKWTDVVNLSQNLYGEATLLSWSSDGQFIVFMDTRNDNVDIYVMKADGSDRRRLTFMPSMEGAPVWQPMP
jgi:Tol biopolymer transport system component